MTSCLVASEAHVYVVSFSQCGKSGNKSLRISAHLTYSKPSDNYFMLSISIISIRKYFRLPWKTVITMAADVARDGFNVTNDLGEYLHLYGKKTMADVKCFVSSVVMSLIFFICNVPTAQALSRVKDQNVSRAFLDLFLPGGQVPLSGLFARRLDLAAILDKIAANGISEFYNGNLTQEIVAKVSSFFFFMC